MSRPNERTARDSLTAGLDDGCGGPQLGKGREVAGPRSTAGRPGQGQSAPDVGRRHGRIVPRGIGVVGHDQDARQIADRRREPADLELPISQTTAVPATYDGVLPARALPPAQVGYLMPWGSAAAALSADALAQGLRIRSVGGAFTLGGRAYALGTALFRKAENPADLDARLAQLAARHGAELVPIDSTYVDSGTSLGSNDVVALKRTRVLLLWDAPASTLSAGWTRYTLERRFGQSVTVVRGGSFGRVPLADFDVVVLPSGDYSAVLGDAQLTRLKDWIRGGGTLVTLAEASRWASGEKVGLLGTSTLMKDGKPEGGAGGASAASGAFDYDKAIQPDRERPAAQPGAILRVALDTNHWLTAGNDSETQTLIEGARVFAPIKLDRGVNVGIYGKKESLIASGLIWPDAQDVLVQKAFLMHQPMGSGHVIAFAEDPNYRGFTEATMLLFINAVLLGPGY